MPLRSPAVRLILTYGLSSLAAVGIGAAVVAYTGAAVMLWAMNPIGWAVGLGLAVGLGAARMDRESLGALVVAAALVALSLVGPGQEGVHRWLAVGPVRFNVAFLVLPAAVVALAHLRERAWVWWLGVGILALLVAQPDASQASAFGAALAVLAMRGPGLRGSRLLRVGVAVLLAGLAWLRPDPLAPVPEVEGVIGLIFALSPLAAVCAVLALAGAAATPVIVARTSPAALALGVYLLVVCAMPMFGTFPVPLVGLGMSPILGFWLGVGLLAASIRSEGAASRPSGS